MVLDDGRILIVGGFDPLTGSGDPATFAAGVLYDPVSGSLSATAPVRSGPALISPERPIGPAIKLADGSVLIAIEVATGQWGLTRFDPAIGTFTIVGSLDGDPGGRDPVLLSDGRVYFVLQDLERCDRIFGEVFAPETGQVTPGVDVPGIGGCNGGPSPTVTTLADGSVLVAGGKLNGGESTEHASVIRPKPLDVLEGFVLDLVELVRVIRMTKCQSDATRVRKSVSSSDHWVQSCQSCTHQ